MHSLALADPASRWLVVAARRRLGVGAALVAPVERVLGARAPTRSVCATSSQKHFGDRSDGAFTVVFRGRGRRAIRRCARGCSASSTGRRTRPDREGHGRSSPPARTSSTATSISTLNLAEAKGYTDDAPRALGRPPGRRRLRHRRARDPARPRPDLHRGPAARASRSRCRSRCSCCSLVFGLSWAVTIPFLFAGVHDRSGRSGSSTCVAH